MANDPGSSVVSQAHCVMTTLLVEQQRDGILPANPSGVTGIALSPGS